MSLRSYLQSDAGYWYYGDVSVFVLTRHHQTDQLRERSALAVNLPDVGDTSL